MKFYAKTGDVDGLFKSLEELNGGITLEENFKGFLWEGELAAGQEFEVPNKIKGFIPKYFLVIMAEGSNNIVKGTSEWSTRYVSVKNADSTTTARVTIFFFI